MSTIVRRAYKPRLIAKLEVLILMTLILAVAYRFQIASHFMPPEPTKDQLNAQIIVSVYEAGANAGVSWDISSRAETIADLIEGKASAQGDPSGKVFELPHLNNEELTRACVYIGANELGALYYDAAGGQPPY
jgi:hypothetical protein